MAGAYATFWPNLCQVKVTTWPATGGSIWVPAHPSFIKNYNINEWNRIYPAWAFPVPDSCKTPPQATVPPSYPQVAVPPPVPPSEGETIPPSSQEEPPSECGPSMITTSDEMTSDVEMPLVTGIHFLSVKNANNDPSITQQSHIVKEDGEILELHRSTGSGIVVYAPPELQDYQLYGHNESPDLAVRGWPNVFSNSSLTLMQAGGPGEEAKTLLSIGKPLVTTHKPGSGWYFDLNTTDGILNIQATDDDGIDVTRSLYVCGSPIGGGSGETNTASNVGTGVGIYQTKVGVDLRFHSLSALTTNTITTTIADAGDEIQVSNDLIFPVKAPDNVLPAQYTFNAGVTAGSDLAGMGFDQDTLEGPKLTDITGTAQLIVTTGGVTIPEKLTVVGGIDPVYLEFTAAASNGGGVPAKTIYIDDGTNYEAGSLVFGTSATPVVMEGEVSVGAPGFEQGGITVNGVTFDANLKVNDYGGARSATAVLHRHSTSYDPALVFARSNSDTSAHAIVTSGQSVGCLYGVGWDGTDYAQAAKICMEVDGTPGSNDMPGRIVFSVSPDGSHTPAEAMRISQDKSVRINSILTTLDNNLYVMPTVSASTKNVYLRGSDTGLGGDTYIDGGNGTLSYVNIGANYAQSVQIGRAGKSVYILNTLDVGHASDTTLARVSAGDLSIEGNLIYRAGGTDVPITDGGTGSSTADGALENLIDGATVQTAALDLTTDEVAGRDVSAASPDGRAIVLQDIGGLFAPSTNDFRLTGTTATPVMTADSTALSTIYLTPYKGNRIALYDTSNSKWKLLSSAEVSLAVTGRTTDLPFDIFAYNNSGTVTLEFLDWASATARSTAIARQDGVWTKSGDASRRYLGTCRPRSATSFHWVMHGVTAGTAARIDLWNMDNRVDIACEVRDTTNTWTYTTTTWRQARASAINQIDYVCGLAEDGGICISHGISSTNATLSGAVQRWTGIGLDSTSTPATYSLVGSVDSGSESSTNVAHELSSYGHYAIAPAQLSIGRHYLAWLERSEASGTTTWYGDNGGDGGQAGILFRWRA